MLKRLFSYANGVDLNGEYTASQKKEIVANRRRALSMQFFSLIIVTIVLGLFYLTVLDRDTGLSYTTPFPIVTEEVFAGESVTYFSTREVDLTKNDGLIDFGVTWVRHDIEEVVFGMTREDLPITGGHRQSNITFELPDEVGEGIWSLRISVRTNTNFIHEETIIIETEKFEVVKN